MTNTFSIYQQIKKSGLKVLIEAGYSARKAISEMRKNMPYLFAGKSKCDSIDAINNEFDNHLDWCEKTHP